MFTKDTRRGCSILSFTNDNKDVGFMFRCQVWRLIIRIYILPPGHCKDLFIHVPSQLPGEHTALPFWRFDASTHGHLCPSSEESFPRTKHRPDVPINVDRGETPYLFNPLAAKLFNLNFHPLEVVSRWRDPQLQVSKNYSDLTKWRSTVFKYCWLMSHFIFTMFKRWYKVC